MMGRLCVLYSLSGADGCVCLAFPGTMCRAGAHLGQAITRTVLPVGVLGALSAEVLTGMRGSIALGRNAVAGLWRLQWLTWDDLLAGK